MRSRGLSLIELLTVVSILGVLLGLTIPAARSVVRFAIGTVCLSHLRQVGAAALTYADEWSGLLPAKSNFGIDDDRRSPAWFDRLPDYVELPDVGRRTGIFQCAGFHGTATTRFTHAMPKSFKMNAYLDAGGRPRHY